MPATLAEIQAAHDTMVACAAQFDQFMNGGIGETVTLGGVEYPTLQSLINALDPPPYADLDAANLAMGGTRRLFNNLATGFLEVTSADS